MNFLSSQTECLMGSPSPDPMQPILNSISGIDFLDESACSPLYLNCNIVFLRRDNGTGSFPENDPKIQQIIDGINVEWSSIGDPSNCGPNGLYPVDSKVRVKVLGVYFIDNTLAWDWYTQALALDANNSYYETAFCPGDIITNNTWPALKTVI